MVTAAVWGPRTYHFGINQTARITKGAWTCKVFQVQADRKHVFLGNKFVEGKLTKRSSSPFGCRSGSATKTLLPVRIRRRLWLIVEIIFNTYIISLSRSDSAHLTFGGRLG